MQYSSQFNGKTYQNPVPTEMGGNGFMWKVLKQYFKKHPHRTPAKEPGPFHVSEALLQPPPPLSAQVTWLGHSTLVLDVDGKRFLTDPVWYKRVSPFKYAGPKRFFDVPIAVADLPPIDYILLSHDHYDHLDRGTLLQLTGKNTPVICLLGVKKRLVQWGVPEHLVTELDWWQQTTLENGIVITACPSRHFSGRSLGDRFTTLWGSFAIKGPQHNIYFGADSGYYPGFKTIGEKLGPFDLTLLDSGAYYHLWANIHMGPENAVQAHLDLQGKLLMPIHWGTFALAFHPWTEPAERVLKAAKEKGVPLVLPAPGETYDIAKGAYNSGWWLKYQ